MSLIIGRVAVMFGRVILDSNVGVAPILQLLSDLHKRFTMHCNNFIRKYISGYK